MVRVNSKFIAISILLGSFLLSQVHAAESRKGTPTLRLFADMGGQRRYFTGYDWLQFDIHKRLALVEKARRGAVRLNAVMTLPAEIYVRELDNMFRRNSGIRHIELGQAIQGVAIALKDWDDGSDPTAHLESHLNKDKNP